ncbi:MAG: hypothetical protein RLZZ127_792 [Planctomycetota bacterium]|jgi:hypothetical protein
MLRALVPCLATVLAAGEAVPRSLVIRPAGGECILVGQADAGGAVVVPDQPIISVELPGDPAPLWRELPPVADAATSAGLPAAARAALDRLAQREAQLAAFAALPATGAVDPRRDQARAALLADLAAAIETERSGILAGLPAAAVPPPAGPRTAAIVVAGSNGQPVAVRQACTGLRWWPSYRVAVAADGSATLTRIAMIRWEGDTALPALPITLETRDPDRRLLLAPPSIPTLGTGETVDGFATPELPDRGRESAVNADLRWFRMAQRPDGTWGGVEDRPMTTALVLIALLGGGHDHKVQTPYRRVIQRGLEALVRERPDTADLRTAAIVATAVSEAFAMTQDPELKPVAVAWLDRTRALHGAGAAEAAMAAGDPMVVAWLATAWRSARSGGLDAEPARVLPLLPALAASGGEAGPVAAGVVRLMAGQPVTSAPFWERVPAWIAAGRWDLVHGAHQILFQAGGEPWQRWQALGRDRVLAVADAPPAGPWDPAAARALATMTLTVFYRSDRAGPARTAAPPSDPVLAPSPWPARWSATAALRPGLNAVEIDTTVLSATMAWHAVPLREPMAWRRLTFRNPFREALPAGPVTRILDGRPLEDGALAAVPPGTVGSIDLGRDERVRVERRAEETSDDGWTRRTLTVRLRYRVQAPPGVAVEVVEPMPTGGGDDLRLEITEPALGKAQADRLRSDPFWRWTLADGGSAEAGYTLTYPPNHRPRLETQP